ncbi:tetratricopeptide repeat protein [Desulfopila aestuarii]|uniref:Tfp pilus assembly protein PilF n=1 Tax=Desulfopila aestuarii DSM 18488 TaxID=1121416 RepID=A0A1M7YEY0_9BACT|nr:tetratricopeptide repeat protein [Desulfopila aestuarii]SHO51202.1 Tfp pilus assembly protein PilF [Desulfopila aestuarii DSM 18488]
MSIQPTSDKKENTTNTTGRGWEICALLAACIILLTPFVYRWRVQSIPTPTATETTQFAGTDACKECHQDAYKKWQGSDHDRAMAVANDDTVAGDFNNVTFTDPYNGKISRFFRENGKFMVETEGPDGKPDIFTISYTFGFYPLQQYLVPFPGGRLQCLTIAWDVEKKCWYRVPPYEVTDHTDWLHWTRGGQTWNVMCAECHSTRLQKDYDVKSESYNTSWFEINVGCEACHGPAAQHVEWAKLPVMGRPETANYALNRDTHNLPTEKQIAICAPCHSRRYQLADNTHMPGELLDLMVPALLAEDLYHADGQIKEEVYVYGSFIQSKMYRHGVRCNDCHDAHSLKTHKTNNELCTQCHQATAYDSKDHHFHEKTYKGEASKGYLCVSCHMPGQNYMGIDYRPDHSLRIPRPDLTRKIGTPNACSTSECHGDKGLEWVEESYTKWYGQSRKRHYGEAIAAGRKGAPEANSQLTAVIEDPLQPAIVRATALSLLGNYQEPQTLKILKKELNSDEPLLRHTALRLLDQPDEETALKLIAPKLYDPVKAVRLESAVKLASFPRERLREDDLQTMQQNLDEYRQAMEYNADFAPQRYNIANLERDLGNPEKAIDLYLAALRIDNQFIPAKVNLAMEYNRLGKNEDAEKLLQEVVTQEPEMYRIQYSLGLLLSEMNKYDEAALHLELAADGMPYYSRARYNYALVLLKLERWQQGAEALEKAVLQDPDVTEYFVTLTNLYFNFRMNNQARALAEKVLQLSPDNASAKELLRMMDQARGESSNSQPPSE